MLVADFIARCGILLQDANNVRWKEDELVRWLNDAQRATVMLRPEANAVRVFVNTDSTLSSNNAYVKMPAGCIKVLDVICNAVVSGANKLVDSLDVNGTKSAITYGTAVRQVSLPVLDATINNWRTVPYFSGGSHKNWALDERDPTGFWVYPYAIIDSKTDGLLVLSSELPTSCITSTELNSTIAALASALAAIDLAGAAAVAAGAGTGNALNGWFISPPYFFLTGSAQYNASNNYWTAAANYSTEINNQFAAQEARKTQLNDVYTNALLEYVLYKAYSKDAEYAQAGGRAALHYQAFVTELGLNKSAEADASPTAAQKKSIYPRN